ncbi:MAG: sulfatase-like hydrolase/transferase [Rhodospirillaceae bacterium]|nr:sulfatase-like hydrolase/transferase [Rhodospirillaceae bacterium]
MGRKILLITTDQQRHDALGCTGGSVAKTPAIDRLAATGLNFRQARNQNTVCMPERATILTGQYIRSHGVTSNGIPLPVDAPNLAAYLHEHGYRTALLGKAHFEPASHTDYFENWAASQGVTGPHRGFDRMELCGHTGRPGRSLTHYPRWLRDEHPEAVDGFHEYTFQGAPSGRGGGDTGAPQVWHNSIPREQYHTDWTADRTMAFLDTLSDAEDWFVWMSFPDPHHPWDPPQSELGRVDWRDLDLPRCYPGSAEKTTAILAQKPRHWLEWYEGRGQFNFEVPPDLVSANLTADQIREVNAMAHISNELIDEAVGRVVDHIDALGWGEDTDIFYTTDHGEFQGDFGMLFKGPYHVEGLMRLPFIWRPAPVAGIAPEEIHAPVGHVDLAPTICTVAGLAVPDWMQGQVLPTNTMAAAGRERTITEWQDSFAGNDITMRTLYRDGYICTVYERTNYYDTDDIGELYDLSTDPQQWRNLWDAADWQSLKSDLVADLYDSLPAGRDTALEKVAQV